jgi:hypothetical protein
MIWHGCTWRIFNDKHPLSTMTWQLSMRFAGLSLMPMYYTRLGVGHTTRSIQAPSHYVDLALSRTCILISRPAADSRSHICRETSSGHHGWISGSSGSALASVHKLLRRFDMWEKEWELEDLWDMPVEGTLPRTAFRLLQSSCSYFYQN